MMQLSSDQFTRLTGNVPPPPLNPGEGGGADRRQHVRLPMGQRAQVRLTGQPWRTVVIRDISVAGVGLMCEFRRALRQPIDLRTAGLDGQSLDIACLVHRCESGGVGRVAYFVGAAFDHLAGGEPPAGVQLKADPVPPRSLLGR